MIKLNEEGIDELWNSYDTMQLLYTVMEELSDLIDEVDMTVFDMIEQLRRIREALKPLEKMFTWEE